MRRIVPVIAASALACATAGVEPVVSSDETPRCQPLGWWYLKVTNHHVSGDGCKDLRGRLDTLTEWYVGIRPGADGALRLRDAFSEGSAELESKSCHVNADVVTRQGLYRQWGTTEPIRIDDKLQYVLRIHGTRVEGTLTFLFIASRPGCGAPCTMTASVEGVPFSHEEAVRMEEDERKEREREKNPIPMSPKYREELLAPLRKMRGPGSCWSVDED